MELFLRNHDYKYAVEQIMLMLFPDQRPVYPERLPPEGFPFYAVVSLEEDGSRLLARTELVRGGRRETGEAAVPQGALTDEIVSARLRQRIIKQSFYQAALRLLGEKPVWGTLSGVRPARLMRSVLRETGGDAEAACARFMELYDVSRERTGLCLDAARRAETADRSLGERDVCLYLGIPFCPTRCAYCSFVSQSVERTMEQIPHYLKALRKDMFATAAAVEEAGLRVVSVYLGGGTPTILSAPELDGLLSLLETEFSLDSCLEITVEAGRPDTITAEKLEVLREYGVTRLSVNPQSMSDRVLRAIGRRHRAEDILRAMELVRAAGGFSVNMDLIAGLPEDTAAQFRESVEQVLRLEPENITLHTLALKKGSRITLEGARLPDGREVGEMLSEGAGLLRERGYQPYYLYRQKYMSGGYENVGWCLPGQENLYNICVMEELRSVIAMGAGGSTKLTVGDGRLERMFSPKYPKEYIEGIAKVCGEKMRISAFYDAGDREEYGPGAAARGEAGAPPWPEALP